MRKFTKHILSVLLCVVLCCAVIPAPAFAASGETGQESGQAPAGGMEWTLDELEKAFLRQGEGPAGRGLAGLCRAAPGCGPPGRADRGDDAAGGGGPGQDRQDGPTQALHGRFHPRQHGERRGGGYAG